jgi:hypothetical protein
MIQEWQIRETIQLQIIAGLPESSLEVIEDHGDLKWEETGKEFYLHGELFDVVKTRELNGKTFYYCLNDLKENQLNNIFDKIIQSGNGSPKGNKFTIKFQLSDFTIPAGPLMKTAPISFQEKYFKPDDEVISTPAAVIPSPPWV